MDIVEIAKAWDKWELGDGHPPPPISHGQLADEIMLLRQALVKYGDRARMATVEPMELQQAIDRAFENVE